MSKGFTLIELLASVIGCWLIIFFIFGLFRAIPNSNNNCVIDQPKLVKNEAYKQSNEVTKSSDPLYIVTLKFTQSSFTLNIVQHIKDSFNSFEFSIPVDKRFYNSVKVGDELGNKFKTASFVINGNIGSRKVIVTNKFIKDPMISH